MMSSPLTYIAEVIKVRPFQVKKKTDQAGYFITASCLGLTVLAQPFFTGFETLVMFAQNG